MLIPNPTNVCQEIKKRLGSVASTVVIFKPRLCFFICSTKGKAHNEATIVIAKPILKLPILMNILLTRNISVPARMEHTIIEPMPITLDNPIADSIVMKKTGNVRISPRAIAMNLFMTILSRLVNITAIEKRKGLKKAPWS